jgi:hypothetical protein
VWDDEGLMKDALDQNLVTSTAAAQQTEPEVVAAISSGDGQIANEQAIRELPMPSGKCKAGRRVGTSTIGYARRSRDKHIFKLLTGPAGCYSFRATAEIRPDGEKGGCRYARPRS